jgi:DNA-binding NarL/FixJ family response regulator
LILQATVRIPTLRVTKFAWRQFFAVVYVEDAEMNPTTQQAFELHGGLDPDLADGTEPHTDAARAIIVDDNQRRAASLAASLKLGGQLGVTVVAPDDPALRELLPADLVLLALGGRTVSALGIGAEAVQKNPFTEVVFYCDDPDAPEVSAASVLGITRIVPAQHMTTWLARGGSLLARGAFLRRAAAACAAAVPRPPTLAAVTDGPSRMPLPTAEMQFRESYIRFLLGESGSRQEAARRAGVPYRTMCEMIRKLGIGTA